MAERVARVKEAGKRLQKEMGVHGRKFTTPLDFGPRLPKSIGGDFRNVTGSKTGFWGERRDLREALLRHERMRYSNAKRTALKSISFHDASAIGNGAFRNELLASYGVGGDEMGHSQLEVCELDV